VSWPILWLFEAHVLALCGMRLGEPVFRRLGLLAGFASGLLLAVRDVFPLVIFRLDYPDPERHLSLSVALALAAVLFWIHGEVYPRRWPEVAANELETFGLRVTSWLGMAAAAAALWACLPAAWVATGWLALVLVVGLAADWKGVVGLALQADLLAVGAVAGLFGWDFMVLPVDQFKLPTALGIALLYGGMRRRTVLAGSPSYVAPAYSWVASLILMNWLWRVVPEQWLALTGVALALVLFETGRFAKKGFLRWQGFVAAMLALVQVQMLWFGELFSDRTHHGWFSIAWSLSLSAFGLAGLGYWLQERTRGSASVDSVAASPGAGARSERRVGILAGVAGTLIVTQWLPLVVPGLGAAESASIAWAVWAVVLLGIAWFAHRTSFRVYAIVLSIIIFAYGAILDATSGLTEANLPWSQGVLFRLGVSSGILLAGLFFAFRLRKAPLDVAGVHLPDWVEKAISRPEQWFFFVPFGLMIVTFASQLRMGNITLGWSLLGLGAFLFALAVGERSFRLGGLALLLVSVVKILLMDVWALAPVDRYTTLIVLGCALLLVSFLYTRFRDVFRRYM
jgi:hypothetical protein